MAAEADEKYTSRASSLFLARLRWILMFSCHVFARWHQAWCQQQIDFDKAGPVTSSLFMSRCSKPSPDPVKNTGHRKPLRYGNPRTLGNSAQYTGYHSIESFILITMDCEFPCQRTWACGENGGEACLSWMIHQDQRPITVNHCLHDNLSSIMYDSTR